MAQPSSPPLASLGRAARVAVAAGLTVILSGCAIGASTVVAPVPSIHPPAPPTAAAGSQSPGATPGIPATVPGDDALVPPEATLRGVAGPPAPAGGALGSFTWGESGTDAPWLVPPAAVSVAPGGHVAVAFGPDLLARRWIARWAPVRDSVPGAVGWTAEGAGPVAFAAPASGGTWSLQVDARFGLGRQATWYWRVEVMP